MSQPFPRHIHFESVPNFRDLGGYRTHDGRTVAWRRVFRSATLHAMNDRELARLKEHIGPRAVIDLRSPKDPERNSEANLLREIGARYYPMPFRPDSPSYSKAEVKANPDATDLGAIYLSRISEKPFGKRLVDALDVIADRDNHPLIFDCSAGKDRTGVLAAMVLAAMGIVDDDVVEDYILSAPVMKDIRDRLAPQARVRLRRWLLEGEWSVPFAGRSAERCLAGFRGHGIAAAAFLIAWRIRP